MSDHRWAAVRIEELCAKSVPVTALQSGGEPTSTIQHHSAQYVWYAVFLLTLVNVFNAMDRTALAVLAPAIRSDLQLSDSQLGLLTGFAFALFYAVCGIPIARWADRGVRRNIIALALATWSVMTALSGAAQTFWQLLFVRAGVGAGEAGSYSPGASILCDHLPNDRRPAVFSIHAFGLVLGLMLSMALAGWLSESIGWRWTFVVLGAPGIALAVIVRLTLREPVRGLLDGPGDAKARTPFGRTVETLWRCRSYRWLTLYLVVNAFVQNSFIQWWPSYYTRVVGLPLSTVGISLSVAIGIGMGVGLLMGGLLGGTRWRRGTDDTRLRLLLCAVAISLALPPLVASLFVSSVAASIFLVGLAGFFFTVPSGPVMASLYSVTAPQMRATAGAMATFLIAVLGQGLGPYCVGLLSDVLRASAGELSLRYALLGPACLVPIGAIGLSVAARTLARDLQISRAPS